MFCFCCHSLSLSFLQLQCQKNEIISSSSQMVFSFHKNCVIRMKCVIYNVLLFCVIHCSLFRVSVKRNYNLPYFSFLKTILFHHFWENRKEKNECSDFIAWKRRKLGQWNEKRKNAKDEKKEKLEKRQCDSSFLLFTLFCIDYKWSFLNSSLVVNT